MMKLVILCMITMTVDIIINNGFRQKVNLMTNLAIWERLVEDYLVDRRNTSSTCDDHKTAALFIGSKGSGKTSLIKKFTKFTSTTQQNLSLLLPEVEPTPNVIDYYYVRRPVQSKEGGLTLGHIFDIGSNTASAPQLFELIAQRFTNIVVVIVVDLSRPDMMYKEALVGVESARKMLIHKMDNPNRVIVVATKMDKLSSLADPDNKRTLLNALRCLCHHNECSLLTLSLRNGGNGIKIFTSYLRANLFPTTPNIPLIPPQMANTTDYSKELAISFGTDSLQDIDEPYEGWEVCLSKMFPTSSSTVKLSERAGAMGGLERQIAAYVEKEKIILNREINNM